ncbi:RING/U-box [Metschnikowia bicuspidata var. bicuspidata NRRL YB-4993]|uniref:RING/U-box n=1 Tax=Metschnikowia bicuspidata var. bicuspidata NRRL YB-4993 TaxID=869754 RepID=A0A1A0HH58_9ASCO|nr:RING/U-box [Metschnikowia bicuspidata var. bicuspidata NRRL YB-4993]OBA23514.1 RING/U-box [Metschnikowia bicuspidata var. bicuspidata NRRL YB-4993]
MNDEDRIDIDGPDQQIHTLDHDHPMDPAETQTEPSADGAPVAAKKKPRFEVKKWTAVAFWSWDIVVDTCAICRNHLMEPCIECEPNSINNSSDQCIAAWGTCNHAFHLHCIQRWLKSRPVCPLDNKDWTYQKFGA